MNTRLIFLSAQAEAPPQWLHLQPGGHRDHGHGLPLPEAERTLLVVPGAQVRMCWLSLPAGTPPQVHAAARLALAEHVAQDPQGLHLALGQPEAGQPRLVAALAPALLRDWLAQARLWGIVPDTVVPDCLMLAPAADGGTRAVAWDGRWLLRGPQLAASLEPELARLVSGRPDLYAEDNALAQFASGTPALDLLQHAFARNTASSGHGRTRRLRWLAAALLLSPLVLLLAQIARYEIGARVLEARAAALVGQATGRPAGDDPLRALSEARRDDASARLTRLGNAVADSLVATPGTQLQSLDYRQDGPMKLQLLHPDAAALQRLRQRLQAAGVQASPGATQAAEDGNQRTPLDLVEGA
ncbi:type II secretion system protein GspL [Pseudoxanthomonas composti]|uniref:Type II secretion system protein GspL n=1 Tax=Pseudoxanthomonas composti TaxID=2137479 RepID=A0A4Q1JZ48_9GAMM|nr:type II secretion system protein GspL [Pseudoxanthomonas composti]RXR08359.1 type II secretion system protein GspL [Pseudoxanthomonas composti]